jgi:hypothetical protein
VQGIGFFRPGTARPPAEILIAFIDEHQGAHGVEPICKVLDCPIDVLPTQIAAT